MGAKSSELYGFQSIQAITPSDTLDVPGGSIRGFYVGVAGDVAVIMPDGSTGTWPALAAGIAHPIQASRIKLTGTTATGIVGGR
jgi:hypothetical protein